MQIDSELFFSHADNNIMKHITVVIFLLILGSSTTLLAKKTDTFFFQGAFGASSVMYGDEKIVNETNAVIDTGVGRFTFTADLGFGISLDNRIRVITGGLLSTDLCFNSDVHANRLDYSFFLGIRIYPDLAGFNFGIDYTLGRRTDFLKLPGLSSSSTSSTPWGNGFRANIGYDFSYNGLRFAPIVQGSYRMAPRGGSFDHYFSLFINFNLFF